MLPDGGVLFTANNVYADASTFFALLDNAYEERSGCLDNLLSVSEYHEFGAAPRFIKLTKEVGRAK